MSEQKKIFSIDETPLSEQTDGRMRKWLVCDECVQMRAFTRALIAKQAALASELRFNSPAMPPMLEASEAEMKKAQDYQTFLNVLEEFTERRESFVSIKINPV